MVTHDADWFEGSAKPNRMQKDLIKAYRKLGHPELAACVREGDKYVRLAWFFIYPSVGIGMINGLEKAFLGKRRKGHRSMQSWMQWAKTYYQDDQRWKKYLGRFMTDLHLEEG
jgi:hypothetical protein